MLNGHLPSGDEAHAVCSLTVTLADEPPKRIPSGGDRPLYTVFERHTTANQVMTAAFFDPVNHLFNGPLRHKVDVSILKAFCQSDGSLMTVGSFRS
jgi:hypothetical protein